jgi:hypothetical protein
VSPSPCLESEASPRTQGPRAAALRRLVVLGLAGGAAACSSMNTSSPALPLTPTIAPPSAQARQTVSLAADRTLLQSVSVSIDLEAAQVFGGKAAPVRGTGVFDFAAGRGREVLLQPAGEEVVIFQPASVFVRQPLAAASALPSGKRWISAGLTESPALTTNFPQFVVQAEGTNPAFLLTEVALGDVSAAPLGSATVNGEQAQGYLVGVDLVRAESQAASASGPAGASGAAFVRAIGYELTAAGATGATPGTQIENVRVWIDGRGRVVQIQASPPASGVGVTTMTFSSFGTAVSVSIPPKLQIADVASLSPGGERENNGGGDSDGA